MIQGYLTQLLATTDVASMARVIGEAYQLSQTQARDIAQIREHYDAVRHSESNLHTEIMAGLKNGFAERKVAMRVIEHQISELTKSGEHAIAKELTLHFMELLKHSPTDAAIKQRSSFYGREG